MLLLVTLFVAVSIFLFGCSEKLPAPTLTELVFIGIKFSEFRTFWSIPRKLLENCQSTKFARFNSRKNSKFLIQRNQVSGKPYKHLLFTLLRRKYGNM